MKRWLLLLSICFSLTGCAKKIEISELGVVSGIGIDKSDQGYLLTAQVVNPSSVAGNHFDTLPVYSISAEGKTLFEAYRELSTLTAKVLYLPHISVIVISEEIAKEGIDPVLDFTLRNVMIRPNISLTVANNTSAQNILHVLSSSEQIPINQIDALSSVCTECTSRQVSYNLYHVDSMVNNKGTNIVLNSVAVRGEDIEQGEYVDNILEVDSPTKIQLNALAAFKEDKLVGYLDSEEAEYYNVLVDLAKRYVLYTMIDNQYEVTFEGHEIKVDIQPDMNTKKVKVKCETKGILMENDYPINLLEPSNVDKMQSYLEKQLKINLEHLISKTQHEFGSDILGVGSKIHQKDPKTWSQLEVYWEQIYPTLDFEVEAKVEITSVGQIANSKE